MNNPKLNLIIRFTLELFIVLLLVSDANQSSSLAKTAKGATETQPGDRPAAGVDIARVTLDAGERSPTITFRGMTLVAETPDVFNALAEHKPDQIVVVLTGQRDWQRLFSFALENDVPICVEISD